MVPAIHTTDVHADQDSASGTATVEFEGGGLVLEQVPNFDFGYHYLGDGQVYSLRTSGASADAATQLGDRSLAVAGTPDSTITSGWSVSVQYLSGSIPTGTYLLLTSKQVGQNNAGNGDNTYTPATIGTTTMDANWRVKYYSGGLSSTDLNNIPTSSNGTTGVVPMGGATQDAVSIFGRTTVAPDTTLNSGVTTTGKVEYKYFFNAMDSAYMFVPVGKQSTASALTGTLEWTLQKGIPSDW
jgi:hypothetical protein